MRKSYAVLGSGRFGSNVAKELYESGADVILIDRNPDIINRMSEYVTCAYCGDIGDTAFLKEAGVAYADAVVIAFAELEPAILAVMTCKELGVPNVIVKAKDEVSGEIFLKVGADKVVYPEKEAGLRLAHVLLSNGFLDFFELSDTVSMVEMLPKKEWVGKSLKELNLRKSHHINVIAIKEKGDVKAFIDPDMPLREDCALIVTVHNKDLKKLRN